MKNLFIIFLLFTCTQTKSQSPDWEWARSGQAGGFGEGYIVATDIFGNVFASGYYGDTIQFNSFILTDFVGAFLVKYDSSGNVKWAKTSHGLGMEVTNSIATDQFGNCYVTGFFNDTVYFDSFMLANVLGPDIFVVKYDSAGNVLWAKSEGGISGDYGNGVSIDIFGNIYVTGNTLSPLLIIGSDTIINAGVYNIYLVKYDSTGNVLWAKGIGGSGHDMSFSVTTDILGNAYITGTFDSPSIIFGNDTLINAGVYNLFLTKYDSSGNVLWAESAGGTLNDRGLFVAADSLQNVYLSGMFSSSSITFGSHTLTNAGGGDAFIVKYNSFGNVLWAKGAGGSGNENGWGVSLDKFDKVYLVGGVYPWAASSIFDTIVLQYLTGYDPMFIAGYDTAGNILFAKGLRSGGDDQNAIAVSPSGSIYICSDFAFADTFIVGIDTLFQAGYPEDVFVAKLSYQSTESISEINNSPNFILFPNPFSNSVSITTNSREQSQFVLYDILSRKLLQQPFSKSSTINTEKLASGIYIYELLNKNGRIASGKLIKQ